MMRSSSRSTSPHTSEASRASPPGNITPETLGPVAAAARASSPSGTPAVAAALRVPPAIKRRSTAAHSSATLISGRQGTNSFRAPGAAPSTTRSRSCDGVAEEGVATTPCSSKRCIRPARAFRASVPREPGVEGVEGCGTSTGGRKGIDTSRAALAVPYSITQRLADADRRGSEGRGSEGSRAGAGACGRHEKNHLYLYTDRQRALPKSQLC
jgi:hypothetical protein